MGVGSLLGGGGNPNVVLSVVATTVVAVAFQPVRRWLQRVANRLVFGRRSTPYDVLSGFATRVGAGESSPESLVHVAELLAGGTGADPARVWLRVGSTLRAEATWPPSAVASWHGDDRCWRRPDHRGRLSARSPPCGAGGGAGRAHRVC